MAKKTEEEQAKLKIALANIEKIYGKGSVMQLGDAPEVDIEVISSQSLLIDAALGIGGFPRGRVSELFGMESSGKSTLTLHVVAEAQKNGLTAAFIDAEHALDLKYARALNVDTDSLIFAQPDNGEQGLDILEKLIDTKMVDLVIVDSVAALVPKAELDGEMGDQQMGLHARLMSKALRKITGKAKMNNVAVIFINQLRHKIGISFGNPEVTTGGNALKFYASVRVELRRSTQIKDGEEVTGNKTKIKVVKNKMAPPFRTADVDIMYGLGIDRISEVLDISVDLGNVQKKGSWFSYEGTNLAQGRDGTVSLLRDNPELFEELRSKIGIADVEIQE